MAKSEVPEFGTLKECLEFLYYLKSESAGKGMQYRVTRRLVRLLEKKYEKVNKDQIETALSTFLTNAYTFHTKLCKKVEQGKYKPGKATDALYALLKCVPKFLSVIYFLRHNVDDKFAAVGGGKWKNDVPGWGGSWAMRGGKLQEYLTTQLSSNEGIIPGGFGNGDLKMARGHGDYPQGYSMVADLEKICDKKDGQYFRDVFVTSVLAKNSGVNVANVANALRLVRDFCGIFGPETDENEFKGHVQSRGMCINWQELVGQCIKLKESLGQLFTKDQFSFTGYGRTYDFLYKSIDKRMASWLKRHLNDVRTQLAKITPENDVNTFATKHLFPYGFTFDKADFRDQTAPYKDLKKVWDNVIGKLQNIGGDLDELKTILDGTLCQQKSRDEASERGPESEPQDQIEPESEPDSEFESASEDEDTSDSENEATKSENTSLPANRADGTPNQGKKSEGAQNQGKKAEGAQNQGKKAEGDPNQENGQSEAASSDPSTAEAVQTQTSSDSSAGTASSGAPGSSGDRSTGGQADSSGSAQGNGRGPQSGASDSNTASGPSSGSGGGSGKKGAVDTSKCGVGQVSLYDLDGTSVCYRKPPNHITNSHNPDWDDVWNAQQRGMLKDVDIILPKPPNKPKSLHSSNTPTLSSQSSLRVLGHSPRRAGDSPGSGLDYYEPRGRDDRQGSRSVTPYDEYVLHNNLTGIAQGDDFMGFDGHAIPDKKLKSRTFQKMPKDHHEHRRRFEEHDKSAANAYIERIHGKEFRKHVEDNVLITTAFKPSPSKANFIGEPMAYPIKPPKFSKPANKSSASYPTSDLTGQHIPHIPLEATWPPSTPTQKHTGKPLKDVQPYPHDTPKLDEKEMSKLLEITAADVLNSPGNDIASQPVKMDTPVPPSPISSWTIPDPKKHHPSPTHLISKLPKISAVATTTKIPHEVIPVFLGDINRWASEASGQHILDPNVGRRMPPLPTSKPTAQHDHTSMKPPITAALGNHDMDSLTNITISDIKSTPKTLAQVSPLYAMATGYPLKPPKTPSTSEIHLLPAPKPSMKPIRMKPTGIAMPEYKHPSLIPHAPIITDTFDDPSMDKLLYAPTISMALPLRSDVDIPAVQHITPPTPPMPDFNGTIVPDSNLDSNIPKVYLEHPPPIRFEMKKTHKQRKTPDPFEIDIHVPKLKLPDNNLEFDLDFDDDSTHIKTETLPDPVDPPFPAVSFNIAPPDVEQSMPPPQDFDPEIIHRPELKMCLAPWATSTPTPGSTNIPETELFPAEVPRTVRDMLTWLAGLKNEKHHKTLEKCINKAFGGIQDDPSQLALSVNGSYVRPTDVFDILQLTAMFAGSVLTAIAPRWRVNVSSRFVKPKSSDQSDDLDCCALLCQLRDYVYACHHQLQFLKAQCSRNELHGGWQNCSYGGDAKISSPLQSFLTDGWDSDFETHLFDPCNLCHKSCVRMGFKRGDLPTTQQTGATISSILSPSCGGDGHDTIRVAN